MVFDQLIVENIKAHTLALESRRSRHSSLKETQIYSPLTQKRFKIVWSLRDREGGVNIYM